jgi:hypothetical protein
MFGISGFFKNIQNAFTKEVILRTEIKEVVKKCVGLDLQIENISCKNGVITLKNVNSSASSAVFIKKTKILEMLKRDYKREYVNDIR